MALAWLTFLVCPSISVVVGQNEEHVKLHSVELVASSPVVDIEDNLTFQTSITIVGKC